MTLQLALAILIVRAATFASFAIALGPVKFGPEFTMANFNHGESMAAMADIQVFPRMKKHLIADQPEGEKFECSFSNKLTSPAGWWFQYSSEGTIEIQAIPASPAYYRKFKDDMQDAIFDTAAKDGYYPALYQGGGHINLGIEAFEGNDLLLRNFIIDMFNHNELFMGIFNYDTNNALPFNLLNIEAQKKVKDVIREFDAHEYKSQKHFLQLLHVALNVGRDHVFNADWKKDWSSGRGKYHAVNFSHAFDGRIELRGVRPQASMDVWVRQITLIEKRLQYLEKLNFPLVLEQRVAIYSRSEAPGHFHLDPPLDSQVALQSFYVYVTESGERWSDHRDYLWPQWISSGKLKKFESSDWFLNQEGAKACEIAMASG